MRRGISIGQRRIRYELGRQSNRFAKWERREIQVDPGLLNGSIDKWEGGHGAKSAYLLNS